MSALREAASAGDETLLIALGEYGRRWEMLVEVELPLGRPTELTVEEDRPLRLERAGWARAKIALKEARSTHIEISLVDPNVDINGFEIRDLNGGQVALGPLEAVRYTRDTLAVYNSERPFFVTVGVRLRPARYAERTNSTLHQGRL